MLFYFLLLVVLITLRQLMMVQLSALSVGITLKIIMVTVPALSAPKCNSHQQDVVVLSTPSPINPSGGNGLGMTDSAKTSLSANLHGQSSESDQNDEDLHAYRGSCQLRYIL